MRTLVKFADDVIGRALPHLPIELAADVGGDWQCGELEVALITLLECAPNQFTAAEIDEFEQLARAFDWKDRPIAERVIAKVVDARSVLSVRSP